MTGLATTQKEMVNNHCKNEKQSHKIQTFNYFKISIFILAKLKSSILSNNPAVTEADNKNQLYFKLILFFTSTKPRICEILKKYSDYILFTSL